MISTVQRYSNESGPEGTDPVRRTTEKDLWELILALHMEDNWKDMWGETQQGVIMRLDMQSESCKIKENRTWIEDHLYETLSQQSDKDFIWLVNLIIIEVAGKE